MSEGGEEKMTFDLASRPEAVARALTPVNGPGRGTS
jgi:hypothetical protein